MEDARPSSSPPGSCYQTSRRARCGIVLISGFVSALILIAGCATSTQTTPIAPAAPETPSASTPQNGTTTAPPGIASGTWLGTTTTEGNGIRKITLRMTQQGGNISGDYSCMAGNTACRNLDDSGEIAGKLTGNSFNVAITMSPDNSKCYFAGQLAESIIYGTYQCLAEARIVEIGTWRVKRLG